MKKMKQRMKAKASKIVASILVAAMAVAIIPKITGTGTVFAAGSKNGGNTCLGTSGIAAPAVPASADSAWSGSYVYYGTYNGNPIKFRVLAPSTTAYGGSTLFLDSDATLFNRRFDDDSNVWANSELRTYLNGTFLTGGSFTELEQGAIASSTVPAHDLAIGTGAGQVATWTQGAFDQYVALNGDKIFVLDAEEASNIAYGYSNTDESCSDRVKGGSSAYWWLRSAYTGGSSRAGEVNGDGILYGNYVHDNDGVAPALNINLSSVIFSTAIDGDLGALGTSYKLTILNDSLFVNTDSVSFSGTTISGTATGNAEQVSILITDGAWDETGSVIKYYSEYTSSLDISSYIAGTSDLHVYLIAEDINDTKSTDYASKPAEIKTKVTVPDPVTPDPITPDPVIPEPKPEFDPYANVPTLTSGIAHVQDIGDVSYTTEAGVLTIGTRGMGKRLEEITINFENTTGLSGTLEYRVHVQDIGWMDWVEAGQKCGTEGMSKRIEAIEIRLTGELAEYYSVQYCVHIQDYGDMQGWVKDGALAGTTGESKRIEELKIKIVPANSGTSMSVKYRVHVQDYGWEGSYAADGKMSGTSGESKRLEGIEIFLDGTQYTGGIKFKTHVQDYGWQGWSYDGEMSGTQGESKRLEGICIELYGEVAEYYDIYYRVHAQDIGWMAWAKNGECAGTAGRSARLEGIQIVLVPKGEPAPGATYEGITAVTDKAFVEGF